MAQSKENGGSSEGEGLEQKLDQVPARVYTERHDPFRALVSTLGL